MLVVLEVYCPKSGTVYLEHLHSVCSASPTTTSFNGFHFPIILLLHSLNGEPCCTQLCNAFVLKYRAILDYTIHLLRIVPM